MAHGKVVFLIFLLLGRPGSNHLSQNSTGLQIHLRIPGCCFCKAQKRPLIGLKKIISNYFILTPWEIRFLKIFQLDLYLCDPSSLMTKSRSYELCFCRASQERLLLRPRRIEHLVRWGGKGIYMLFSGLKIFFKIFAFCGCELPVSGSALYPVW